MQTIARVAILLNKDSGLSFEAEEAQSVFFKSGIEVRLFYDSDSIIPYAPDCVIATSPQDAKLTPYPTYGLINLTCEQYLHIPRFLRNILTYDGYLTTSSKATQMLRDLMFGARKLHTSIYPLQFTPTITEYREPDLIQQRIVLFEPNLIHSKFKQAIHFLLSKFKNIDLLTFSLAEEYADDPRYILLHDLSDLDRHLQKYSIGICLNSSDNDEQVIYSSLLKLISASLIVITQHTDYLQTQFADSLFYFSQQNDIAELHQTIKNYISIITDRPQYAEEKCRQAHQIFNNNFALNSKIENFSLFHYQTLSNRGYLPRKEESNLPSVSYIIRTGGKHRPYLERTLDSLVAQQYPNLCVILVIHAKFSYLHDLIAAYPTLRFTVLERIGSRRSEAIRDGMAVIDTELFGLFDDDDELFPNHIRSLVRTLQYHHNRDWRGEIGMVYSGSIQVNDTYPVKEAHGFHDHLLQDRQELRAIEHFRFYSPTMLSQLLWYMPNGWLARSKLIDAELLDDPVLDTCEDFYFEAQLAQKTHFAFSVEVTAVHHFHSLGNSTIEDSYKHLADTQRIALRNFMRPYPTELCFDTVLSNVGKIPAQTNNAIQYMDKDLDNPVEYFADHPYFPARRLFKQPIHAHHYYYPLTISTILFKLPVKLFQCVKRLKALDPKARKYYIHRFKTSLRQHGVLLTIKRTKTFFSNLNEVC